jgi:hypothetical protein
MMHGRNNIKLHYVDIHQYPDQANPDPDRKQKELSVMKQILRIPVKNSQATSTAKINNQNACS